MEGGKSLSRAIEEAVQDIKRDVLSIWVHRKGNEAFAAVYDAILALYPKEPRPQITKKVKDAPDCKEFLIYLPPGHAYAEFKKKELIFADAAGGSVQIDKRGKQIKMTVSTSEIKSGYSFAFNPENYPDMFLPVHFGFAASGEVVRDLAGMPNLIVAGHPGAGKSNFLHVVIMCLLLNQRVKAYPVILDFKRLEYKYLQNHGLVVTEMDQAREVLAAVNRELNRRLDQLEKADSRRIQDYIQLGPEMPFIVLVIDELAEMQDEQCQQLLNRALRLGRAPGICIVCATQRPSSTMFKAFGDSKAMFAGTQCFHVRDAINSQMVLDNDRAALIPAIPGRAVFQWDTELEVQAMELPLSKARQLLKGIPSVGGELIVEQPQKRLPAR